MWFAYDNDAGAKQTKWLKTIDEEAVSPGINVSNFVQSQTGKIEIETLRGFLDSKLVSLRQAWEIIISADQLSGTVAANYTYIIAFWNSGNQHYIDYTTAEGGSPSTWTEVEIPNGEIPIEFIEGNFNLQEFSAIFLESDGSV